VGLRAFDLAEGRRFAAFFFGAALTGLRLVAAFRAAVFFFETSRLLAAGFLAVFFFAAVFLAAGFLLAGAFLTACFRFGADLRWAATLRAAGFLAFGAPVLAARLALRAVLAAGRPLFFVFFAMVLVSARGLDSMCEAF
jgi:hypothetical protein